MIICEPKNKKEFLALTDYILSEILVDLSRLLVNLTNYDGIEDDDVLFYIASKISSNYGNLTTTELIVKSELKDLEGE